MQNENISNETRLTRIQALVVEILNDLLRAPIDQTDDAINDAIGRLGDYCLRDRSYVFVRDGPLANNTHEWCAEGIDPMIELLQGLPIEMYGSIAESLDRGEHYHVPDVAKLDADSPSRALLESQGIQSILLVPMLWENQTYGFVGFDAVRHTQNFLPGEIYLLQSVADVICSVLVRREKDQAMRSAQAELADERAFLASILETSAMGLMVLDDNGIVRLVNDEAQVILGATREQMIGMSHVDSRWRYTHEDGRPVASSETPFEKVLASGAPVADIRFALHCDDGLRYCSVHAAPVTGGGAKNARVVYALLDVTQQVASERAREDALDKARRANAAKSNFLAKMSHEMRTPLNGVLGVAEMLEQMIDDPDQKRLVAVMHDSGALLLSIINDLLDMSKIEADQLTIEAVPFVPADIAKRLESVHTLKASEKKLSFAVHVTGDSQGARLGDPHRVLQIMHNVISNAIKFTETGSISVAVDCTSAEHIRLTTIDTGIGMTDEQRQHVFEEFGQADSSIARRFGGTGLGMPIVRRLTEMMGGDISLTTAPGQGTTVIIDLPLTQTNLSQSEIKLNVNPGAPCELRGVRVLAADDNRTNRMILGAMMGQLGIAAALVSDGTEALKAYDADEFDLVILDISMPDIDGLAVLKEIRAREAQRASSGGKAPATLLPIVAFTANAMAHQVDAYLKAGFDDCLTKPLQLERLRNSLSKLIAERGRRNNPAGIVPLRAGRGF